MLVSQEVAIFIFKTLCGQRNKAIFPRQCRAAIPTSLIKQKIQQSANFEKERLETKINALLNKRKYAR